MVPRHRVRFYSHFGCSILSEITVNSPGSTTKKGIHHAGS